MAEEDELCDVELTRVANVEGETREVPLRRSISAGDARLVSVGSNNESPLDWPNEYDLKDLWSNRISYMY